MKIKLKDDLYDNSSSAVYNTVVQMLAGKTLDVDTEYLFADQFNTAGLSEEEIDRLLYEHPVAVNDPAYRQAVRDALRHGIRFHARHVDYVIDDVRLEKSKCRFCGRTKARNVTSCRPGCLQTNYLYNFERLTGAPDGYPTLTSKKIRPENVKRERIRYIVSPHGFCEKAGYCVEHERNPDVESCQGFFTR